ncbi:MAG: hypothetical protein ACREUL_18285 [Steroidobacteraceae bacterium]
MISAQDIAGSPAWLPLEYADSASMRLVRLDESGYRASSFLDQRILKSSPEQALCPPSLVAQAAVTLNPGAHYLFHIGHVGSTLLSRLIGECTGLFSVREPAMLRAAASHPLRMFGSLSLHQVLSLLGRTWRPQQRPVVKATSFVSEIAELILEIDRHSLAIFMFTPALAYLRCILGGPNSRVESRTLAPSRLARLQRRLEPESQPVEPRSEGEWIAMSWLCEMAALRTAADRFGSRVVWVDFDAFLSAPAPALERLLQALGAAPGPSEAERLAAGPLMHRYSKAPEHAYDAALRRMVLESADREHGAEIRRGMQWLGRLAGRHRLIDTALSGG